MSIEQAVAAPLCTRHLADLGARVIKIESVDGGDFTREYDNVVLGMAAHFVWLNRNKESVALDLKSSRGREVLEQLLGRADVVVQNLGPGAAKRLSIAAPDVVRRFPSVVAVDISGYGTGGPYDDRRAYDVLAQSEGGSCAITGWPGRPAKPGIPVADVGAAMYALTSILAALHARHDTGRGAAVSVCLLDVIAEWMGFALNQTRYGNAAPQPSGVSSPMVAPYGAYPTNDGDTVVLGTTNDAEFRRLAEMIGEPQLADDPSLIGNARRVNARRRLDETITRWTSQRSLTQVQTAAHEHRIGYARLNQVADVLSHPQLTERHRWVAVGSPVGPISALLPPFDSEQWTIRTDSVPALGEHSAAVLSWLGYPEPVIDELTAAGLVGTPTTNTSTTQG
ncbi:formyl-CoA transferase [Mycobacterium arosiense ATCC BAA-1401 = DSM 45069]|uniref:Formyl-CoA transferase n=1 Tax=Mycobacterium arosiense ATCC BAA-1401 = DSM 45069 TaxID=1265311 RepID=A0A1W9ZCB8_MYCAI|nr:formyl-CoA transferase [Mycobacterium arosiense ATCC BAA-1401 = DSM 45069]